MGKASRERMTGLTKEERIKESIEQEAERERIKAERAGRLLSNLYFRKLAQEGTEDESEQE